MSKMITGAEYPLGKVFSDDFEYHIPQYQRPYAWTTEETNVLFTDLRDFFVEEDEENYFLGSTVLIKKDDERRGDRWATAPDDAHDSSCVYRQQAAGKAAR